MDITEDLIVTLYVSNRKNICLQQWPGFITQTFPNYRDLEIVLEPRALHTEQ